jgi:predicted DNA-binding protein (MmcQ/YjbR family)
MKLESLRTYMQKKPGVTEETPFGPEALVFKVVGKMFALVAWQEEPLRITLKCDPELAITLRSHYPAVTPGYHMNKKHWNTILLNNTIPAEELMGMIDGSYALVVSSLKKTERRQLAEQGG